MQDAIAAPLRAWESFYVIIGSSGAALTGLQFVVMALVTDQRGRSSSSEIDAFATPTIVHFCAVLFVSSLLSAPWHALSSAALVLGALGLGGVGYIALVFRRARRQTGYVLVLEDWVWHTALPFVAYAAIFVSAIVLGRHPTDTLFVVAATTILLLFIGIHNAWDTVTYIAAGHMRPPPDAPPE